MYSRVKTYNPRKREMSVSASSSSLDNNGWKEMDKDREEKYFILFMGSAILLILGCIPLAKIAPILGAISVSSGTIVLLIAVGIMCDLREGE